MPAPGSEIPAAQPIDLAAAIRRAGVPVDRPPVRGRGTRAVPGYEPSVPETEFKRLFPLPYRVESVSMYEAKRHHWKTDRSYWQFLEKFQYVSPQWGRIEIPKGFYTDFASVPPQLHSFVEFWHALSDRCTECSAITILFAWFPISKRWEFACC